MTARKPLRGPLDPRHGTENRYTNLGCRCEKCRVAHRVYCARVRRARAARVTADDPRHGTRSFYVNHNCRCGPCTTANTQYVANNRQAS